MKCFFEIIICILFAASVVMDPIGSGDAAKSAISVCVNCVIPSLFPFFVCSRMLISLGAGQYMGRVFSPVMKPVFRVGSGGALAFVLGIISGYPVGAKTVADLVSEGEITSSEGEKLLAYCNNSGPLFILGAVGGGILGSRLLGILLYLSHFLSSLCVALVMRKIPCEIKSAKTRKTYKQKQSFGEILTNAVEGSAQAVFVICGFVIIFALVTKAAETFGIIRFISALGIKYDVAKAFVYALLEPTGGCIAVFSALKETPFVLYPVLSLVIAWSGISVHLQVLGIIKKAGLSSKYYFLGKFGMCIISPIITLIMISFVKTENIGAVSFSLPWVYIASGIYVFMCIFAAFLLIRFAGRKRMKY